MEITGKMQAALSIAAELATREDQGPMTTTAIARSTGLSVSYIEVLCAPLRRAGLIVSARGPGGGYNLGRAPDEITVLELAKAVDPDAIDRPRHTVDETEPSKETKSVQRLFEGAAMEIKHYLESSTVADAIEERVKHRQTASVESARSRSVWDDAASHSAVAA